MKKNILLAAVVAAAAALAGCASKGPQPTSYDLARWAHRWRRRAWRQLLRARTA